MCMKKRYLQMTSLTQKPVHLQKPGHDKDFWIHNASGLHSQLIFLRFWPFFARFFLQIWGLQKETLHINNLVQPFHKDIVTAVYNWKKWLDFSNLTLCPFNPKRKKGEEGRKRGFVRVCWGGVGLGVFLVSRVKELHKVTIFKPSS